MSDLDHLRDLGTRIRQPEFDEILAARHRRTRRNWAVAASAVAAATAVAVVALTAPRPAARTDLPPVDRTPTGTATPDLATPVGQQTIVPEIAPGSAHGWEVLARVTNAQPAHLGAVELTAVVPDTRQFASTYCRGAADLYWFLDIGDGSQGYERCSPDAATTLAPDLDITDLVYRDPVQDPQTIRMWVARPTAAWLACMDEGRAGCTISEIAPLPGADVEIGFEVYAHEASVALQLLDDAGNGASYPLSAFGLLDGTGWLLDRAVVAAPGADHLLMELPASDRARLVDVYPGVSQHLERCRAAHEDELPDRVRSDHLVYEKAFDEACGVDLRLVVDGERVRPEEELYTSGHFQVLGAALAPGDDHEVVVEVVRGDPRDATYAVVVRRETDAR